MSKEHLASEDKKGKVQRPEQESQYQGHEADSGDVQSGLAHLQNQIGNRAVQRLLAQRSGEGSFELDDETAGRINRARGGGQPLDSPVQEQMSSSMDQDFSSVRVHTSPESDDLNRQLGAKAFTTGQDIFFREGAYQPQSSGGQELIAHELTHVVQQGSGAVKGGPGMTVNAPGDAFEQEADAMAGQVAAPANTAGTEAGVQRQESMPDDEKEDELQMKAVQRQEEMPEDEEDEGADVQTKALQREETPEEEQPA